MDINSSMLVDDVSLMYKLDARIRSFQNTAMVDGKKFRWRYTVIPYYAMARLGFFYHPIKDYEKDDILKDAVGCIYCRKITHNFGECRSKKKNTIDTMMGVLRQHLGNGNSGCLLSHLKLNVLENFMDEMGSIDWNNDQFFSNPVDPKVMEFRKFSFNDSWPYSSGNLSIEKIAEAGLLLYDSSYTGFEEIMEKDIKGACYCVYCKKIVGSWQLDDCPLQEHYKSCNGGKCFFFDKLKINSDPSNVLQELREKLAKFEHNSAATSIKSNSETLSSNLKNVSESTAGSDDPSHELNESSSESEENSGDIQTVSPTLFNKLPPKKKRKLKKFSTRMLSDDNEEVALVDQQASFLEDKDLVVKFKEHVNKAKAVSRKNRILDDSNDDFSFSNHGHSTFEIPSVSAVLPTRNVPHTNNLLEHVNVRSLSNNSSSTSSADNDYIVEMTSTNKDKLESFPIDGDLSSDSSPLSSDESTPIHSPKLKKDTSSIPSENHRLRPIRKCKIN